MSNYGATQCEESGKKSGKTSGNNPAIGERLSSQNSQPTAVYE